jgi:hemerythrin-like domain-containing protein
MREPTRRGFLVGAGAGLLVAGCAKKMGGGEAEVLPTEDLMREHGVLNRILLIYEEAIRRLAPSSEQPPFAAVASGAELIRRFIEQYHEKLEEDFLFPRFEGSDELARLVTTLRQQHRAGRALTDEIMRRVDPAQPDDPERREGLADGLARFVRMYRPHEAREDTVLFPAFRERVPAKELRDLGERFEDEEHELFGPQGFEHVVAQVAELEKQLGIYELAQFTPMPG